MRTMTFALCGVVPSIQMSARDFVSSGLNNSFHVQKTTHPQVWANRLIAVGPILNYEFSLSLFWFVGSDRVSLLSVRRYICLNLQNKHTANAVSWATWCLMVFFQFSFFFLSLCFRYTNHKWKPTLDDDDESRRGLFGCSTQLFHF